MSAGLYTYVDLFAGCGGLSEGFLASGHYAGLAHVEWERPMVQTLRRRLVEKWGCDEEEARRRVLMFDIQKSEELLYGNWSEETRVSYSRFNSIDAALGLKSLLGTQNVDLVIGGPPCQAYSIHGRATDKNSMNDDYRNFLFESFVKVVDALRPRAFVFENVKGMLSARPGGEPVVDRIYRAFAGIGYETKPSRFFSQAVFNAQDYGVPQSRERVILWGVKSGGGLGVDSFYDNLKSLADGRRCTVRDAIGHLPPIYPLERVTKVKGRNLSHYSTDGSDPFHRPRHCSARDIQVIREWIGRDMNRSSQKEAIEMYKKVTGKDTLYRKYRNLEWDMPSPTVVAHLQKDGFMFLHPDIEQARFISVREAANLMTFPEDYAFVGNMGECYKMIGNAVPVNFAKAIAEAAYITIS